ncbi:MAG: MATE family efflux transporter [Lachnospiraceae bacterium]|nr:MATE family efflux transporter [Lachnospiraceae bacterium]
MKNLTEGAPGKVLWKYSIPLFVSVIFQQIYSIADSVIAGKYAGEDALAAVGDSYPVTMIFMAIAIGSNIGCSVVISRYFGAKRYREMKSAVSTTMLAALVLSAALTVLGLLLSSGLMKMISTPDNIFRESLLYFRIYIGGFVFLFLYNIATGIFTSLGDSRTPLWFLIGSSLGNIALDYYFVAVLGFGVAGVAWATFLAQGLACVLALLALRRRTAAVEADGEVQVFSWEMFRQIARIAGPSILQQSFVSVGNIFIQRLINSNGSSVIAGYSAAIKLNTFTITSFTTLGNGVSNFTSQNIGAGREERVGAGFKAGVVMAYLIAVPFVLAFLFAGGPLVRFFMKEETELAVSTGVKFLRIVSPFYFIISLKLIADGVLRGGGAMTQFMVSTLTDLVLRVVLAYLLYAFLGTLGIWLSWPIGWAIAAFLSCAFYRRGCWKPQNMRR